MLAPRLSGGPVLLAENVKHRANGSTPEKLAVKIHVEHPITVYCPCRYFGKQVDLKSCGDRVQSDAKRYEGRKCAQTNAEFSRMEGDLYNLWPVIGELNGLRSNYSMAQIAGKARTFGGCGAKIQQFPVTSWECRRAALIGEVQKNENAVLKARCTSSGTH